MTKTLLLSRCLKIKGTKMYEIPITYFLLQTIASACLLLAAKVEEDEMVKTRDVVNVAYRLLDPLFATFL